MGIFIFMIFIILIGKLFSLQVVNGFLYLNRSREVSRRTHFDPFPAGENF